MPNVHVDAGPKGSPTPDEMIADTKDGVMIDGRGSYSIDQQRYNGQFGGNAFWEIKNGKRTRMVTNVTYNAITTDFWANLDAISGKEHWQMFGTGGDAKGQPTQTNSISHGSPWLRIRKIMVGGGVRVTRVLPTFSRKATGLPVSLVLLLAVIHNGASNCEARDD